MRRSKSNGLFGDNFVLLNGNYSEKDGKGHISYFSSLLENEVTKKSANTGGSNGYRINKVTRGEEGKILKVKTPQKQRGGN